MDTFGVGLSPPMAPMDWPSLQSSARLARACPFTDQKHMSDPSDREQMSTAARRVIKRYSNRKLYDTRDSRYVTLLEIAELVRAGEDVQVIDNATKEDKTDVTLALIISEELKARPKGIPLNTLRSLIFEHGERLLNQLRDVPIKKLVPWESEFETGVCSPDADPEGLSPPQTDGGMPLPSGPSPASSTARSIRATLEQWQQAIDERIRAIVPNFSLASDLELEVKELKSRLSALEARVGRTATVPTDESSPQMPNSEE